MNDEVMAVRANALNEAGHRLSLNEQRIVLLAISKIRRDNSKDGTRVDSRQWYTVTAEELAEAAGIASSTAYTEMRTAVEHLWERDVRIVGGPNGKHKGGKGQRVTRARWVQGVEYERRSGKIRLMFSEPVTPYLTQLYEQFTPLHLEEVSPMRTRYGPRLYELIRQWRRQQHKPITVSIEWLKETWGIPYKRVYDIKRHAIEPAVRDVERYSRYTVTVSYKKQGRQVTHAVIEFRLKYRNSSTGTTMTPEELRELHNPQGKLSDYAQTDHAEESIASMKAIADRRNK